MSLALCGLLSPMLADAEGTWLKVQQLAPAGIGTMLLLSDGTVMAEGSSPAGINTWYRLTPDSTGGYTNGTWTTRTSMNYNRLYFSSAVLQDGRVFVAGAEYGNGTTNAEVYNPFYSPNPGTWTEIPVPSGLITVNNTLNSSGGNTAGFVDSGSIILSNGNVLVTPVDPAISGGTVIFNPFSNTLTNGPTIFRGVNEDEASLVKLPDDSILVVDFFTANSERYIPSLNQWIDDAIVPNFLYDAYGKEMGAGLLLPNGKAFFIGSTPVTALYTPSGNTNAGTWTAGPNIPANLGAPDAPAAMMVNGKILCALSPTPYTLGGTNYIFTTPTYFFEYDYNVGSTGAFTEVHAPNGSYTNSNPTFVQRMLDLPDGTVLFTDGGQQLYVYVPDGSPLTAGKPVVQNMAWNPDGSLHLSGTLFNGISAGATYGEDAAMDSNYPLIRFKDDTGTNYYGTTYNWSSTSIMTGNKVVTTKAVVPSIIFNSPKHYTMQVVANGIASDSYAFNPLNVTFDPLTNTETIFDFSQIGGKVNEEATVSFRIQQYDAGGNNDLYWNGTAFVSGSVYLPASLVGDTWSPAGGVTLPTRGQTRYGAYFLRVAAVDAAGNGTTNEILLTRSATDSTPPIVTLDNIHNGDVLTNASLPGLSGSALDFESGIASVDVFLNRFSNGDILYWNGSSWSSTPASLTASYNAQTVAWQVNDPLPSGDNLPNAVYQVQVSVANNESPSVSKLLSVLFSVDYHPVFVWTAGSFSDLDPNNNNNEWDNAANWDALEVPGTNALVIINSGTPNATGTKTVHELRLLGGSLTCDGLVLNKKLLQQGDLIANNITFPTNTVWEWKSGNASGIHNIQPGGNALFSTTGNKVLADNALVLNRGTVTWSNSSPIVANGYSGFSTISNLPGATFQIIGDGQVFTRINGYYAVYFVNGGMFSKVSGSSSSSVDTCQFINDGEIHADTGNLDFNATVQLNQGGLFTGTALTRFSGNQFTLSGTSLVQNATLELNGGNFIGAGDNSGTFATAGTGLLVWSGGTIYNTINLATNAQAQISGAGTKYFADGARLDSRGQVNWSGGTMIVSGLSAQSFIRNRAGATFTVTGTNAAAHANGYYLGQFENQPGGLLRFNIAGLSPWTDWELINNGVVQGDAGTLQLQAGGASSGVYTNLPGAELRFTGGTFSLHAGTTFIGGGTTRVAGGSLIADGYATAGATNSSGQFVLDSGVVGGTGFTSLGQFLWNSGTISGTFSNAPGAVLNLHSDASALLDDYAVFNNRGVVQFTSPGLLRVVGFSGPSTWNNLPGSLFEVKTNGPIFGQVNGYYALAFNNSAGARLAKTAGTNSLISVCSLNNSGELRCDTGTLAYDAPLTLNDGTTFTGAGLNQLAGNTTTLAGAATVQASTLNLTGATLAGANTNASITAMNGALFNWSGGTIAGTVALTPGSLLQLTGAGDKYLADGAVFNNDATVQDTGSGRLVAIGYSAPSYWNNQSGSHFDLLNDGQVFSQANGYYVLIFSNYFGARLAKTAGTNSIIDTCNLNNSGELRCDTGFLQFNTTLNLNPGTTFVGTGQNQVVGGNVTLTGTSTLQNTTLAFSGGNFIGASTNATVATTGSGLWNWSGGTVVNVLNLSPGSLLQLTGAGDKYLADGAVFNNNANVQDIGSGRLVVSGYSASSFWNNLSGSHFVLLNDGQVFGQASGYYVLNFTNYPGAYLAKTNGTLSTIDTCVFNNFSELRADNATLRFNTTLNLNPGTTFVGTGQHQVVGGNVTLVGTSTVQNTTLAFSGGNFIGTDTNATVATTGSGLWNWSGGTMFNILNLATNSLLQLTGVGDKVLADGAVFNNNATIQDTGTGRLVVSGFSAPSFWNNRPGSHFDLLSDGPVFGQNSGYYVLIFTNSPGARVAKTAGTNSLIDTCNFNNSGELRCDTGLLRFNTTLNLNNGGTFTGAGNHEMIGGGVTLTGTSTAQTTTLAMSGGNLIGGAGGTLATASGGLFDWRGGTLFNTVNFAAGGSFQFSSTSAKMLSDGATLNNAGTLTLAGSGPLQISGFSDTSTLNNQSGGVIQVVSNATWGRLSGYYAGTFNNSGVIAITNNARLFQTDWNYTQNPSGSLNLLLAGTTPGGGYSRLAVNSATLNGALNVSLDAGFNLAVSNSFDVMTYSSLAGQFSPLSLPPPASGLSWTSSYNPNALTLAIIQQHFLDGVTFTNGHFQFTLTGPPGSSAVLEASTNLVNWIPIFTNTPFNGSLNFMDPAQMPDRFYRAKILQ